MFYVLCLSILMFVLQLISPFFFFNDTATTEIYTLSLHDALPISSVVKELRPWEPPRAFRARRNVRKFRSEEHTSELQSQSNLVCRLLLEKKKKNKNIQIIILHNNNI